jgi:hypothetical protein
VKMGSERRDSGRPAAGASGYTTHTQQLSSNRIREQREKREKRERGHPYIITGLSGLDNHTACTTEIHLALFCIIWTTPPVAYFGSIQQQKTIITQVFVGRLRADGIL